MEAEQIRKYYEQRLETIRARLQREIGRLNKRLDEALQEARPRPVIVSLASSICRLEEALEIVNDEETLYTFV